MNPKNQGEYSSLTPLPYPVQVNSGGLTFTTVRDIKYQLAFESNAKEFPYNSFGANCVTLSIIPVKGFARPKGYARQGDARVEITIMGQLELLFDTNPLLVINYSCDLADELERHRSVIFGRWYLDHLKPKGIVRKNHKNLSERVHASVLYHKDHPDRGEIEEAFFEIFQGK